MVRVLFIASRDLFGAPRILLSSRFKEVSRSLMAADALKLVGGQVMYIHAGSK
jgi:hypothetical protein